MIAQPTLTNTQKYCLIFVLALTLTLAWTTLAHADGPGDLDTTFGGTGIITTPISSGSDGGFSVAIQPDGKIVVAGVSDSKDFAVIRYNSDGSQDMTFNSTGVVTTPTDSPSWGFATTLQPDSKIVAAGVSGHDFGVVRYTSDGNLDTNFNGTGIVTTSIGSNFGIGNFDIGRSVALQPDGKIVVAGDSEAPNGIDHHLAVVRYNITGTLDTKFNGTGIVTTSLVNGGGWGVVVQPDDKIVVAGSNGPVRYTVTGTLDTSFNGTGVVTIPGFVINSLELQTDGKIVVAGSSGGDFAVARYNSDGSPDSTFNGTGIVTTPITSENDGGLSLAIQLNGKIVVAGFSGHITGNEGDMAVVRYNSDGSLDTTFGNTGIVTTSVSSTRDDAWDVAIQPDGKIVAAGFSNSDGTSNVTFAVVRYIGDPTPTLSKTVDDDTPNPGQPIIYTLSISNSGSFSTTNLLISDTLPMSLTLAGQAALDPFQPGAVLATSPLSLPTVASSITINPMTAITITIPVTVSAELTGGLHLTNTATMTSPEMSISVSDAVVITIAGLVSDKVYLPVVLKN